MILEALAHATARAAPGSMRDGLVHGQAAILGRWLRHRAAWRPHLENCRRFIRQSAERVASRDLVVVLGSGPLLDIPLTALATGFARVVLIDAVQPLHARLLARRLGNVEARCFTLVEPGDEGPRYRSWRDLVPAPDLVVASMLLSQLPLRDDVDAADGGTIVADALADLLAGPGTACVISETARVHRDRGGAVIERADPLLGVALQSIDARWTWPMAPLGELSPDRSIELEVAAFVRSPAQPSKP